MGKGSDNNLPSGVIAALPKDPDQQLAVAQQITQYAVSGRVAKLEAETASLRNKVAEKDAVIGSLQARVVGAETTLAETTAKLAVAMEGQAKLIKDKDILSGQVKKLMCQVSKLDDFKKALMKSLEASAECSDSADEKKSPCPPDSPCGPGMPAESKGSAPPFPSPRKREGPFSCKKMDCPECPGCPPEPPPIADPRASSKKSSSSWKSPMWQGPGHSPLGPLTPRTSSERSWSQARSPRLDGKEFFRQARNRLSYEQFSEFLSNIKELNAHRQSREVSSPVLSMLFLV